MDWDVYNRVYEQNLAACREMVDGGEMTESDARAYSDAQAMAAASEYEGGLRYGSVEWERKMAREKREGRREKLREFADALDSGANSGANSGAGTGAEGQSVELLFDFVACIGVKSATVRLYHEASQVRFYVSIAYGFDAALRYGSASIVPSAKAVSQASGKLGTNDGVDRILIIDSKFMKCL